MRKRITLVFIFAVFSLCGCSKKNERMLRAEETYRDYPLHLLALANKPIDDSKNLDLSRINEPVFGLTPLQLLVEYQWQYRRLKKGKSIKVLKNFVEHGANIHAVWDDSFRSQHCEIICCCIMVNANSYLQELLKLLNYEYVDLSFAGYEKGGEEGGAEYIMGAINFENFNAIPILLPYTKNINSTNEYGHSALHYAASLPAPYKTIKLLIGNGADGTMEDLKGRTPYQFYLYCHPEKYRSKTARLLREASGEQF